MAPSRQLPHFNPGIANPTSAPDGFRWVCIPEEPGSLGSHRGELIKFNDSKFSTIKNFKYDKLSNMRSHIRLLELMAGEPETSEVECQLFEGEIRNGRVWRKRDDKVQTEELVEYEALSWSWGTDPPDCQLLIRKGTKRLQKQASKDLVWALRYLRYPNTDRILWVDAICIDQKNVEEKNHQVQMMSQIYSYADRVCVWLGLDDKESTMAINFIKNEILQLEHFDDLCADERNSVKWQSLLLLMQRQWFFRRWVVQEIALAKDAIIYCGPDEISWKDFSVAVELFVEVETATHRLSEVMKKDPRFYHVPGWFEFVSTLGASLLVQATGMVFRYYKSEKPLVTKATVNLVEPPEIADRIDPVAAANKNTRKVKDGFASHRGDWTPIEGVDSWEMTGSDQSESENENGQQVRHFLTVDESDDTDTDTDKDEKSDNEEQAVKEKDEPKTRKNSARNVDTQAKQSLERHGDSTADDPISQRRPLLSLEYLVSKLSIFEATEPRDSIYALLAIANDGYPYAEGQDDAVSQSTQEMLSERLEQKPFPVNYGRSYADVCQIFIEFCIARSDKSRALDIICRPWAPAAKPGTSIHFNRKKKTRRIKDWVKAFDVDLSKYGHSAHWSTIKRFYPEKGSTVRETRLPSWIPKLEGAPFAMFPHAGIHIMKMGRKNADPLVGLPQTSRHYDAAQNMKVSLEDLSFRKRRWQNAHCMFVRGFILETVEKSTDSSQSGSIPEKWLNLGKWTMEKDPNDDPGPPEEFWRTLVADRGKEGLNPPYYYARACKESIYKGGHASGAVNTSDLINNERNSIVAEFCRRVQAVIWNRSLIKTDRGNLGVANKAVKPGDLVCILYGCSVPVILRRKVKSAKVVKLEEYEDKHFEKIEGVFQKCMERARAAKIRRQRWKALPERVTKEQKSKGKWGKEDVRAWREDYFTLVEKLRAEGRWRDKPALPHRKNAHARVQPDCYYRFLGECYIHGMMDGEAMQRKSRYEARMAEAWAKKKEEVESNVTKLGNETQPGRAENRVQEQDGVGAREDCQVSEIFSTIQVIEDKNKPGKHSLVDEVETIIEKNIGSPEGGQHTHDTANTINQTENFDSNKGQEIPSIQQDSIGASGEAQAEIHSQAGEREVETAAEKDEKKAWNEYRGDLLLDTIFELR